MGRRRPYKFTDKKHSKGGIRSSIAGVIALLCTAGGLYGAYSARGNAGEYLAALGTIAIVASAYGVFKGTKSFQEEEVYYIFSRIGTIINGILCVFWIAVVGLGILI